MGTGLESRRERRGKLSVCVPNTGAFTRRRVSVCGPNIGALTAPLQSALNAQYTHCRVGNARRLSRYGHYCPVAGAVQITI